MAEESLCFRCLACTSSPQLFLTFPELREHFPAAHRTSLQTDAVLLPSSLEALHCFLCSSSPFLKQEYLREHLRSHNLSTSQVIRMSARGRKGCRICEQDVKGAIEEHLTLNHWQDTFADKDEIEEDNVNEDNYVAEECNVAKKEKGSEEETSAKEVSKKQEDGEEKINNVPFTKKFVSPPFKPKKTCSASGVVKEVGKTSGSDFYPSVEQILREADAKLLDKFVPIPEKLMRSKLETSVSESREQSSLKMLTVTKLLAPEEEKTSLFKFCLAKPPKIYILNALHQDKYVTKVMDKNMDEKHVEVQNMVSVESSNQTNLSLDKKVKNRRCSLKDIKSDSTSKEKYRKVITIDSKQRKDVETQKLQAQFTNSMPVLTYVPNPQLSQEEHEYNIFHKICYIRPNPNFRKERQLMFSLTPGNSEYDSTYKYVRKLFALRGMVSAMYLQNIVSPDMKRFGNVVYQNEDLVQSVLQDGLFTFFVDGGLMVPSGIGSVEITINVFPF